MTRSALATVRGPTASTAPTASAATVARVRPEATPGTAYTPDDRAAAVAAASRLAQDHPPDLGLPPTKAVDPRASLDAAARLLVEGHRPSPGKDRQRSLQRTLSRRNTGPPARGLANGYVTKVQAAAQQIVPALRTRTPQPPPSRCDRPKGSPSLRLPPLTACRCSGRSAIGMSWSPLPSPAPEPITAFAP